MDGIQHDYIVSGSQILAETWTLNGVEHFLQYVYDESGAPIGLNYRNNQYAANVFDVFYFEKNLQGDIVAIYNDSGTRIGTYTYDAWGNFTVSATSGITALEQSILYSYNPFRYRGYYYDTDLGMYYLQSRYYKPQWGRFLNADGQLNEDLLGYNLFAYCSNNPVRYRDESGTFIGLGTAIGAVVGAATGALAGVVSAALSGGDLKAAAISGAISGAAIGIVMGTVADPLVGGLLCAGIAMMNNMGNQVYNYLEEQKENGNCQINAKEIEENIDWGSVAVSGVLTFFSATGGSYLVDYKLPEVFANTIPLVSSMEYYVNGVVTTSVNLGQVITEPIIDQIQKAVLEP